MYKRADDLYKRADDLIASQYTIHNYIKSTDICLFIHTYISHWVCPYACPFYVCVRAHDIGDTQCHSSVHYPQLFKKKMLQHLVGNYTFCFYLRSGGVLLEAQHLSSAGFH